MQELIEFLSKISTLRDTVTDKPKKAIDEAFSLFGSRDNPDQVYQKLSYFLQECPILEGAKITEILGAPTDEAKHLRTVFLGLIDFKDMNLLHAMRTLFWVFFMNGETQMLDRIIGQFSDEYIIQNPVTGILLEQSDAWLEQ